MAAAVYGGSPRHSRHSSASQSSLHHQQSPYHHHANTIMIPAPSYLSGSQSSGTVTTSPYHQHLRMAELMHCRDKSSKRKSAVEMLAASKPFYVKSEMVLDRQQQLSIRGSNSAATSYMLSPSRTLPPQHRPTSRRSASSGSELLQTKLRRLLNHDGTPIMKHENVISPGKHYPHHDHRIYETYHGKMPMKEAASVYMSAHKSYQQQLSVHPEAQIDTSVFFPSSAYLSPTQSLPPPEHDLYSSVGIGDVVDVVRAYSPPPCFADRSSPKESSNRNYQRSHSHNQNVVDGEEDDGRHQYSPSYNINSHKSLPDLHSQISRHSPHSEALSCCSRGNRSNRSSSSFNRDSGGSSGHYTHRSEPSRQQALQPVPTLGPNTGSGTLVNDFRRDSGSSTQHSSNSNFVYGNPPMEYDYMIHEELDNVTPLGVPIQFQDNFNETPKYDRHETRHHSLTTSPHNDSDSPSLPSNFQRQKCVRSKTRGYIPAAQRRVEDMDGVDRRILRSKSDISDRQRPHHVIEPRLQRGKSESVCELEKFFDRLGLDDENFEQFIVPKSKSQYSSDNESDSSAVFFSDVSTVDSTRLPDSTETPSNSSLYRPSEPPSIIERNARIIKWLCNIRKIQMA